MSTAIQVVPTNETHVMIGRDEADFMPVMAIARAIDRYNAILEFTQKIMKPGKDFGEIPGTDKPTLLKPGAEKLCSFFGMTPRFMIVEKVESWDGSEPFFYYWYKCQLYRGERLIGEGDGSSNSRESKHRYRWVQENQIPTGLDRSKCESRGGRIFEFEFAIDKAETSGKYGKPKAYWDGFKAAAESGAAERKERETRSGNRWGWEMDSTVYRVPNPDICDQVNTLQKMSQKRAFIAATLIACNASEYYTQDIEDMVEVTPTVSAPLNREAAHSAQVSSERIVPVELKGVFDRLRKGEPSKTIKSELSKISDLMIERSGSAGNDEYNRILGTFKTANPDAKQWKPSMIEQLFIDIWMAYEALPKNEPPPFEDPRQFGGQ